MPPLPGLRAPDSDSASDSDSATDRDPVIADSDSAESVPPLASASSSDADSEEDSEGGLSDDDDDDDDGDGDDDDDGDGDAAAPARPPAGVGGDFAERFVAAINAITPGQRAQIATDVGISRAAARLDRFCRVDVAETSPRRRRG